MTDNFEVSNAIMPLLTQFHFRSLEKLLLLNFFTNVQIKYAVGIPVVSLCTPRTVFHSFGYFYEKKFHKFADNMVIEK